MSEYKLVPVEPTPEMLDAAIQDGICVDGKPVWKRDVVFQAKWKYQQMLTAAPTMQVEPVGWVNSDELDNMLDEVMAERDQLRAECEELRIALAESQANDRQAMYYLNQVREIVGGDDFPDMVERCRGLVK